MTNIIKKGNNFIYLAHPNSIFVYVVALRAILPQYSNRISYSKVRYIQFESPCKTILNWLETLIMFI